jgi:Tfp pilus assembly protein PilF
MKWTFLIAACCLLFVICLLVVYRSQKVLGASITKNDTSQEINSWLSIVKKHPDYRDGYLQLAILRFNMGDTEEAKKLINIALTIDPNFVFPLSFPPELLPNLR